MTFLVLLLSNSGVLSQVTRISIANGNWNNPSIWSPAGIPTFADDSIIINTDVTFAQNIADGQAMFRVNAGATLTDAGNDTAVFGGDRLVVNGYFTVGVLVVGTNDSATVRGTLQVTSDVSQSGTFIVQPGGQFCVGQRLATSDDFINSGSVSTANWYNGATVTGNGGKFCIANYFINSDAISGTIDICDATPNTPFDVNAGTISGSVTYCAVGPCGLCPVPNGIADFQDDEFLQFFPNPFSDQLQIRINHTFRATTGLFFVMYDVNGKEVKKESVNSSDFFVFRENLTDGIYFYRLFSDEKSISSGKIILQHAE
ncbi:hypothetical protein BH11BAC7_BH11BAC7_07060 [soil metagenome]